MGTENSKTVSDNGIQNLSRSDIITIRFKKDSYYEGQTVEGEIILEPKQNLVMNDILIKFKQSEYFVYVVDEKNTVSDLNSQTFFEKRINAGEYLNMNSQMLSLTPNTYKFPFQFTLPRDIPPSFEYPFRNRRASLRYTFSAELLSPYVKSLSETYMWIKARPINIPSQIKHENYVKVKNVGIVSRGQSGIALFTMASNYRINDMLPFTVDIYNEDCAVQVKEVKISIKRIVTFMKTFMKGGKEYQKRTAIIRKKYPCLCDRNSKNSFHYDDIQIRDHDLKDVDYNRTLNPYPFLDDLNLLMPNVKTNLIKCEYSLKATSYFDLSVLGKDRPRVEMPIYITHQLQKEYEYEKDTNQNNGQGVNSYGNNFNSFGNNSFGGNNFGNNNFGNNNSFGNNNNNFGGNNNNNFGGNNNNFGGNNNNNFGGSNNNNFGGNNNNSNNNKSSGSGSLSSSQKFSYEAYIASKKMNTPSTNKNSNNDSWKSKSSFPNYGNNNNNWGSSNNNNNWGNNNNNNNWGNNNNNNNWGNNNNNSNNWGSNNNNWGNNNNNNNNWGNNNNNNNNWGNNNNNNWGNNNNNNFGNNNNNNNNFGGNNYNRGPYGGGFNGSANPFGGGNNDFPSLDNINNKNNSSSSNQPSNPFGDNNGPSNPFGNNNDNPSNPFGNNNNSGNPPNPFGGSGGGSGPYQASYPGF